MVTLGIFAVVLYFSATLTSLGKVFNVIGGFSTTVLGNYYNNTNNNQVT
jgi:hypothetical protein